MNNHKSMSSFEEELNVHGKLLYTHVGNSMMPLLRQKRDILIIEKPIGRLKKYDVPLYKRDSGQYVLHRILKVRKNDYVICGDNQYHKEYGITDAHILGVLTGFVRDGKTHALKGVRYQCYVHLWCDLFFIRAGILWFRYMIIRIKRMLKTHFG